MAFADFTKAGASAGNAINEFNSGRMSLPDAESFIKKFMTWDELKHEDMGLPVNLASAWLMGGPMGMGAMGAGAAMGGGNAWLNGGNLKDILKGGAIGGGMGYLGDQLFNSAGNTGTGTGPGIEGQPVDWSTATAQSGGMTDVPIGDAGAFGELNAPVMETGVRMPPAILETGGQPMMPSAMAENPSVLSGMGLSETSPGVWEQSNFTPLPSVDLSSQDTEPAPTVDLTTQQNTMLPEPDLQSMGDPMGGFTTDPSLGDLGGNAGMTEPNIMQMLQDAYKKMKDPIALISAGNQIAQSRRQRQVMEDAIRQQAQAGFPTQDFVQQARDFMDPAKRMSMIESTPGYTASRDFLMKETSRQLAKQGKFGQAGQGGAVSNNWAVPMADVVGRNAANWDNQLFGQIKAASGMGDNNLVNTAQMRSNFIPAMARSEGDAWNQLWKALSQNQGLLPDILKRQF